MQAGAFSFLLTDWWSLNKRLNLPWKASRDPYMIWLSEIILQQTRVEQGKPYFIRFFEKFPNVFSLAEAPLDEVLKAWEGLGYYSRAKNLHATAQFIVNNFGGVFPDTYDSILNLKGIGPYTAAAIASFSYGLSHPVVDGNVIRLVSRVLGISEPVNSPKSKKRINSFVQEAISYSDPADFNQAIMDAGATLCLPLNPKCDTCPFHSFCIAKNDDLVSCIPYKTPKPPLRKRYFHYFDFILPNNKVLLQQRSKKDIWSMLYEFPFIESQNPKALSHLEISAFINQLFTKQEFHASLICTKKQKLTHQEIIANIYRVETDVPLDKIKKELYLVDREKVSNFAFPKLLSDYIKALDL